MLNGTYPFQYIYMYICHNKVDTHFALHSAKHVHLRTLSDISNLVKDKVMNCDLVRYNYVHVRWIPVWIVQRGQIMLPNSVDTPWSRLY